MPPAAPPAESAAGSSGSPADEQGKPAGLMPLMIGAVVVAIVIVAAFWLLSRNVETPGTQQSTAASDPAPPAEEDDPTLVAAEPADLEPLPPLAESDGFVRALVRRLSSHPSMATWLASPYLVERFVATIENIATGTNPASHLGTIAPKGSYRAINRAGTLEPAPANSRRHELLTQVFTSLDPAAVASTYRRLRPLLQESYAELGYPDGSFDEALADAMRTMLATPTPNRPPALERGVASFSYVNPDLEALPPAQKAFLRMGPENMRRIKTQLQAFADALDMNVR